MIIIVLLFELYLVKVRRNKLSNKTLNSNSGKDSVNLDAMLLRVPTTSEVTPLDAGGIELTQQQLIVEITVQNNKSDDDRARVLEHKCIPLSSLIDMIIVDFVALLYSSGEFHKTKPLLLIGLNLTEYCKKLV